MPKAIDLTGRRYGKLVVRYRGPKHARGLSWWCICDCGNELVVRAGNLQSGGAKSCGCTRSDSLKAVFKPGWVRAYPKVHRSPEYGAWVLMRERCNNPRGKTFSYYGGRGIRVCEEWGVFENFLRDMGKKPDPSYSLDRIDPNKGYSKDNCRWASKTQQSRNRRDTVVVDYEGRRVALADLADELDMPYKILYKRYLRGWSVERIINQPIRKN